MKKDRRYSLLIFQLGQMFIKPPAKKSSIQFFIIFLNRINNNLKNYIGDDPKKTYYFEQLVNLWKNFLS